MRTIPLICALVLFTSCNQRPNPLEPAATPFQIFRSADDSSPIIIADGTIHIKQGKKGDHFRIHGPKHASIKLTDHQPYLLGYGCDPAFDAKTNPCIPSSGNPKPDCNPGTAVSPCKLSVNPSDPSVVDVTTWVVSVCDPGTCPATLTWDSKDHEAIDIKYPTVPFTVLNPGGTEDNGADLQSPGANSLDHASLVITPPNGSSKSFSFTCPAKLTCLTIAYECHLSGNASCGK